MITITALRPGEVDVLCELARTIWRAHYPPIIGVEQTEYMLRQRYEPDTIRSELASGKVWWDTLCENGTIVAFASSFPHDCDGAVKLDKLYVDPSRQRRGYGAALVEHTCTRAAQDGYSKVVLAVNRHNVNAINAYRRYGFVIAEAVVKDIGGGFVMDDYVMERLVAQQARGGRRQA